MKFATAATGRTTAACLAFPLAIGGLIAESCFRICRCSAPPDPFHDSLTTCLYLSTAALIVVNEFVLRSSVEYPEEVYSCLFAVSGAGLIVAGATTIALIPIIPMALFAIILYGLGVLAFAPGLVLGVLTFQMKALHHRLLGTPGGASRRILFGAITCAISTAVWFAHIWHSGACQPNY